MQTKGRPVTTGNLQPRADIAIDIKENLARIQERIAAACRRSGRRPEEVKLVAVSKTVPPEAICVAYEAGLRDFGENRVQEADAKRPALSDLNATWHLVGHLQTNKAKRARELFHWVQSVDSVRVAQTLDQAGIGSGEKFPILIQVNLGEEPTKFGCPEKDLLPLVGQICQLPTLDLRGLMVLPPFSEDPEQTRPFFRRLRELARAIQAHQLPNISMLELSMGMSHDYEVAIEEGATILRLGTAIFGPRQGK